jgi:hypothetical protein
LENLHEYYKILSKYQNKFKVDLKSYLGTHHIPFSWSLQKIPRDEFEKYLKEKISAVDSIISKEKDILENRRGELIRKLESIKPKLSSDKQSMIYQKIINDYLQILKMDDTEFKNLQDIKEKYGHLNKMVQDHINLLHEYNCIIKKIEDDAKRLLTSDEIKEQIIDYANQKKQLKDITKESLQNIVTYETNLSSYLELQDELLFYVNEKNHLKIIEENIQRYYDTYIKSEIDEKNIVFTIENLTDLNSFIKFIHPILKYLENLKDLPDVTNKRIEDLLKIIKNFDFVNNSYDLAIDTIKSSYDQIVKEFKEYTLKAKEIKKIHAKLDNLLDKNKDILMKEEMRIVENFFSTISAPNDIAKMDITLISKYYDGLYSYFEQVKTVYKLMNDTILSDKVINEYLKKYVRNQITIETVDDTNEKLRNIIDSLHKHNKIKEFYIKNANVSSVIKKRLSVLIDEIKNAGICDNTFPKKADDSFEIYKQIQDDWEKIKEGKKRIHDQLNIIKDLIDNNSFSDKEKEIINKYIIDNTNQSESVDIKEIKSYTKHLKILLILKQDILKLSKSKYLSDDERSEINELLNSTASPNEDKIKESIKIFKELIGRLQNKISDKKSIFSLLAQINNYCNKEHPSLYMMQVKNGLKNDIQQYHEGKADFTNIEKQYHHIKNEEKEWDANKKEFDANKKTIEQYIDQVKNQQAISSSLIQSDEIIKRLFDLETEINELDIIKISPGEIKKNNARIQSELKFMEPTLSNIIRYLPNKEKYLSKFKDSIDRVENFNRKIGEIQIINEKENENELKLHFKLFVEEFELEKKYEQVFEKIIKNSLDFNRSKIKNQIKIIKSELEKKSQEINEISEFNDKISNEFDKTLKELHRKCDKLENELLSIGPFFSILNSLKIIFGGIALVDTNNLITPESNKPKDMDFNRVERLEKYLVEKLKIYNIIFFFDYSFPGWLMYNNPEEYEKFEKFHKGRRNGMIQSRIKEKNHENDDEILQIANDNIDHETKTVFVFSKDRFADKIDSFPKLKNEIKIFNRKKNKFIQIKNIDTIKEAVQFHKALDGNPTIQYHTWSYWNEYDKKRQKERIDIEKNLQKIGVKENFELYGKDNFKHNDKIVESGEETKSLNVTEKKVSNKKIRTCIKCGKNIEDRGITEKYCNLLSAVLKKLKLELCPQPQE